MYRIIKASYHNFKDDFLASNARKDTRYNIMEPFEIIFNMDQWNHEKNRKSHNYKKVSEVLYYIEENIDKLIEFKVFMWELESRNIYGEDRDEIIKIFKMFLDLTYWN